MNGIIHPCTHPEDRPSPKTEEEMFVSVFDSKIFVLIEMFFFSLN